MTYKDISDINLKAFNLFNADKITLLEYNLITKYMQELQAGGTLKTFYKNVSEFFKSSGYTVKQEKYYYIIK